MRTIVQIFQQSPYLCALGAIVFLTISISVFDDYRSGKVISEAFPNVTAVDEIEGNEVAETTNLVEPGSEANEAPTQLGNSRTAFFGKIYFYTNVIGLVFSLILTGPVQSKFGPAPGMLLYTLAVLATGVAFLIQPSIQVVFWASVCVQSIAYSIFQWSRELLYTATTAEEKFVAKGVIDTFLFRAGAAASAIALLIAGSIGVTEHSPDGILGQATRQISFITIPAAIIMIGLITWISKKFQAKVKKSVNVQD